MGTSGSTAGSRLLGLNSGRAMGRIGRPQTSKAPDAFLTLLPIPKVTVELEGVPGETEGGENEHERRNL